MSVRTFIIPAYQSKYGIEYLDSFQGNTFTIPLHYTIQHDRDGKERSTAGNVILHIITEDGAISKAFSDSFEIPGLWGLLA